MIEAIEAIETVHAGVRFRSRTEARWAVFFDALGIRWEYEPEAFILDDGAKYLPDFWLPTFPTGGTYVEVKPPGAGRIEFDKALRLSLTSGRPMWLCDGAPDFRVTHSVSPWSDAARVLLDLPENSVAALWEHRTPVIPLADQAERENRFFTQPGYEDEDGYFDEGYAGATYRAAVAAVRGVRFWEPRR